MGIVKRRLLAAAFILAFLVISPLLILYAAGFRYNFDKSRIEKVGLLYITTDPKNTTVSVDDQIYTTGRELVIKSLKPGEYEINISKEDYFSWQKTLEIFEGQSAFIRDLILFKNLEAQPYELFVKPTKLIFSHPQAQILQSEKFVFIYHKSNQEITEIELPEATPLTELSLTTDASQLVAKQQQKWLLINTLDETLEDISQKVPLDSKRIKVFPSGLVAVTEQAVWLLAQNDDTSPNQLLVNQPLPQDFIIGQDRSWLISTEPSKKRSFLYSLGENRTKPELITSLPYSPNYSIADDFSGFLTIEDSDNQIVYLVDTKSLPATVESLFAIEKWSWSKDHRQLLTASEFEVTIHHFENGLKQELIVRLSSPIADAAWHPEENHVFYVTEDSLFLAERDERDVRNIFKLSTDKKDLQILSTDELGEVINFFAANGDVGAALFRQEIR